MNRSRFLALVLALSALFFALPAFASGSAKLKANTVEEIGGAWRVRVTLELPKAPTLAHVPMKFIFTQTMAFERSLIDNHKEPVTNSVAMKNQPPKIESMDVDFSSVQGKIWKGTSFDFSLPRDRGYEAGEWKLQIRTADGTDVGGAMNLTLKGENPVVDRRSMTFEAKKKGVEKVNDGTEKDDATKPKKDEPKFEMQSQEVEPSGPPPSFVNKDAFNPTEEEKIKDRPKGCGCDVVGRRASSDAGLLAGAPLLGLALALSLRRRRG